jgi:uncharacterized repeat protein (TIGR01451 family)
VIPKVVGSFTNRAEARDGAGRSWETSSSVVVGEPKLNVVTAGPKVRLVNRPATYHITVSNPGTMPVTNVVVTSEVTEGMALKSATGGALISNERRRFDKALNRDVVYQEVRWSLGTFAAGEKRTVQMVLQTPNVGRLDHRVTATADRNLEHRAEAQTDFEEATGMSLEIAKSADPIEVGGEVTYTIHAINQGDGRANNIAVSVTVPEQMEFVKDKLDATARVEGQTVVFTLPGLAAKTPATFVVKVRALKPGDVRVTAKLMCDQLTKGGPVTQEETTTIIADGPGK